MNVDLKYAFLALDPPSADTARKSYMTSQGQKDVPHASLGSVEAGIPIVRYWTVRFRYGGSRLWDYTQVIACDPFKASMVASKSKPSVTEIEVVREINREEFEHLTRSSP